MKLQHYKNSLVLQPGLAVVCPSTVPVGSNLFSSRPVPLIIKRFSDLILCFLEGSTGLKPKTAVQVFSISGTADITNFRTLREQRAYKTIKLTQKIQVRRPENKNANRCVLQKRKTQPDYVGSSLVKPNTRLARSQLVNPF